MTKYFTKDLFFALLASLLFGFGIETAQMTNPNKTIGFLNIFGEWDPSLALVMIGALLVSTISYKLTVKRDKPLISEKFQIPSRTDIDFKLIAGAALFGAGWGATGFCPGPTVSGLFRGQTEILIVFGAIAAGMMAYDNLFLKKQWGLKNNEAHQYGPSPNNVVNINRPKNIPPTEDKIESPDTAAEAEEPRKVGNN